MKKTGLFFVIIFSMVLVLSSAAVAPSENFEDNMTIVSGYVFFSGDKINGADVTVVCDANLNSETTTTAYSSYYGNGYYGVFIDCPVDSSVTVTAEYGGVEGSNSGDIEHVADVVNGMVLLHVGLAKVDVQIPEFPTTAIPVLFSVLSFGLVRKKLKQTV